MLSNHLQFITFAFLLSLLVLTSPSISARDGISWPVRDTLAEPTVKQKKFGIAAIFLELEQENVQLTIRRISENSLEASYSDPSKLRFAGSKSNAIVADFSGRQGWVSLNLPEGLYQVIRIDVPHFDLPYKLETAESETWRFRVTRGKVNYAGNLTVGAIRSKSTIDVDWLNRYATQYESLLTLAEKANITFPVVHGNGYPDPFSALLKGRPSAVATISEQPTLSELSKTLFEERPSTSVELAPNGKQYAISQSSETETTISIHDSATREQVNLINLSDSFDETTLLRKVIWLDSHHLAAILLNKAETEKTLFERNIQSRLIIVDTRVDGATPLIYEVRTKGALIEAAPTEENIFYFARNGRKSKVYKIEIPKLLKINQKRSKLTRVDGGQFKAKNVVVQTDGYATEWFFDASGEPIAVIFFNEEQEIQLSLFNAKEEGKGYDSTALKIWSKEDLEPNKETQKKMLVPIAKAPGEKQFYAIDFHEDQTLSLYLVDYENKDKEFETIYTSPSLPIKDIIFNQEEEAIGVVVIDRGLYTPLYFDGQPTTQKANLEVVIEASTDQQVQLVYKESFNRPGEYLLRFKGSKADAALPILRQVPYLSADFNTTLITNTVPFDDADIPYLLTLPSNTNNKQAAPLILLPHGGPFDVFDTPYFDPMSQYFAANGYAVLRVNFRGSGGYGLEHRDAGKKQWGDNILNELLAALEKVKQRDDIDATRVCTVGMSYGGYASLMLNLKSPELFKCAVAVSAVTDMNLFLYEVNITPSRKAWTTDYIGDPRADFDKLLAISPLYVLQEQARFTTPLKLIHGAKDERVSVEHAFRFKLLLEQNNIPFEWELVEDADHHFAEKQQSVVLFDSILSFVDKHLAR